MKGPYERLKYDLRRVWECPVCKRRERTPGAVTYCHCGCRMQQVDGQPVVMKLIEDGVQRLAPRIARVQGRPDSEGSLFVSPEMISDSQANPEANRALPRADL